MKIYLQRPSIDVLGNWALNERFLDASVITVCPMNGPERDFLADQKARPVGVPYTYSPDYLWALLQQDQDALTDAEKVGAQYVDA